MGIGYNVILPIFRFDMLEQMKNFAIKCGGSKNLIGGDSDPH